MTKEERRLKFLQEHPQYNCEVKGNIFTSRKTSDWRKKFKYVDYFVEVPRELKMITRKVTRQLIKDGILKKKSCEVCHNKETQAHHEDYSDPIKVKWFCTIHHAKRHKILNRVYLTQV